jgi:protease IV
MKRMLLIVTLLISSFTLGCFNQSSFSLLPTPEEKLVARVIKTIGDRDTKNRILLLDIDGPLVGVGERGWLYRTDAITTAVSKKLRKATKDKRIKALVIRINSPGGTVTASDIIYREIKIFKEKTNIPVITIMMDMAASGGYYVACASDKIVAHKSTITGSLGVIIYSLGFNGLFEKIGMESRVIKSGELKDMGNPFDEFSDEEKAVFQDLVNQMYEQFLDVIVEGRKIDRDKLRKLADGRVYLGQQALENGLIDKVGYIEDALDLAMKEARIKDAKVLLYTRTRKGELNMYSNNLAKGPEIKSPYPDLETILNMSRPRLMYMWMGQ